MFDVDLLISVTASRKDCEPFALPSKVTLHAGQPPPADQRFFYLCSLSEKIGNLSPRLHNWQIKWSSVILGHLCFRGLLWEWLGALCVVLGVPTGSLDLLVLEQTAKCRTPLSLEPWPTFTAKSCWVSWGSPVVCILVLPRVDCALSTFTLGSTQFWVAVQGASTVCSRGESSSTRALVLTETNPRSKHDEPQHRAGCRQRCRSHIQGHCFQAVTGSITVMSSTNKQCAGTFPCPWQEAVDLWSFLIRLIYLQLTFSECF